MRFSIVIPVLNGEKYIGACVQCLKNLVVGDDCVEIVVIDNGSTDSTLDIVAAHGIPYQVHPMVSIAKLRNIGAAITDGEILGFIDSDCFAEENWLQAAKKEFLSRQDVGIVGNYYGMPEKTTWVERVWYDAKKDIVGPVNFLPGGNMFFHREVFEQVGGFDEGLSTGEDYDICQRVIKAGWRVVCARLVNVVHMGNFKTLKSVLVKERWYGKGMFRAGGRPSRPLIAAFVHLFLGLSLIVFLVNLSLLTIPVIIADSLLVFCVSIQFGKHVKQRKILFLTRFAPVAFAYLCGRSLSIMDFISEKVIALIPPVRDALRMYKEFGLVLALAYSIRYRDFFGIYQELSQPELRTFLGYKAYVAKKIIAMTAFLKTNVPYYRDKLPHVSLDIVGLLPTVDKKIIRENYAAFLSSESRFNRRSTSGTTGEPFLFEKDRNASAYMDAMMHLSYGWHGVKPWDRQARLWGRAVSRKGRVVQWIKDLLLRRKRLSVFLINDAACKKFYQELKRFRPRYFYCYPNALYQFALSIERLGIDGAELQVPIAICTGEILFPFQREKIEKVFQCKVVNEYGSTENGILAMECEYGRLHVLPTVSLEIAGGDQDGFGEIVVTELNSRNLPFMKYRNGDMGRIVSTGCDCLRPFPILEVKEGRIDSYIKCPNGNIVYDAILAYLFKGQVKQFRGVQENPNVLRIDVIPLDHTSADSIDSLKKKLAGFVGAEMTINVSIVDEIPADKSGKLRYFIPL
ncbi:glycosyltransferase [Geomonas azotofigens]|uniref:glycosyltransferase n=1 Tax=Geomonas azotofigens TaxID=2843196 RepID=UPI001C10D156|nr:glycosyltransferase [Geomonas azotofigens]MBU5613503.1 glycosyltransferase [Geomonas azotofigens]